SPRSTRSSSSLRSAALASRSRTSPSSCRNSRKKPAFSDAADERKEITMSNVLVVAELDQDGNLRKSTLSAITLARKAEGALGGGFDVLVLGANTAAAAQELTTFGAGRVLVCEDASLAHYVTEHFAPTVAEVGKGYKLVVA